MALRAGYSSNPSSSHLVGLPVFWNDPSINPTMDWDKWLDLFQVAKMAKYSISITELTRVVTEQTPRVRPLMGDLDEDPANKKTISVMYLSLGEAARKQFMDKYPNTALWELKPGELINLCKECFRKKTKSYFGSPQILFEIAATRRNTVTILARTERACSY